MLSIRNLSASIDGAKILKDISIDFKDGTTSVILGPNGSGKSTLAAALLGRPDIVVSRATKFLLDEKNIKTLPTDTRARRGLFLSFQSPLPLPGVSVSDLLRAAQDGTTDPLALHTEIHIYAAELGIKDELLTRSIHDGFSGGERKKIEALQAAVLKPRVAIFDELDTGVDVDAIGIIMRFLKKRLPKTTTRIFITHSPKLLSLVRPDHTIVLKNGSVVAIGDRALADKIIREGFEKIDS